MVMVVFGGKDNKAVRMATVKVWIPATLRSCGDADAVLPETTGMNTYSRSGLVKCRKYGKRSMALCESISKSVINIKFERGDNIHGVLE